jgi:hypothetical protein
MAQEAAEQPADGRAPGTTPNESVSAQSGSMN